MLSKHKLLYFQNQSDLSNYTLSGEAHTTIYPWVSQFAFAHMAKFFNTSKSRFVIVLLILPLYSAKQSVKNCPWKQNSIINNTLISATLGQQSKYLPLWAKNQNIYAIYRHAIKYLCHLQTCNQNIKWFVKTKVHTIPTNLIHLGNVVNNSTY